MKLNPCLRVIRAILCIGLLFTCKDLIAQDVQPPGFTLDFEQGNLRGWESSGQAFANQPTLGDNPIAGGRNQSANQQGRFWIGTYENYQGRDGQSSGAIQGDEPTGVLISSTFTIPDGTLSFLIGGSSSFETRVELDMLDPIEGRIRLEYASGQGSETMQRVVWDLSQFAGNIGQLRIIDESSNGHINVDDFNFSYFDNLDRPTVELMVTNNPVQVGESTILAAMLEPGNDAASYNFHFGNDEETGWSKNPRVSYTYNSPGNYEAFVEVNPNPDLNNIRSNTISIEVTPESDLLLRADASELLTEVNNPVSFTAQLEPSRPGISYEFYFGDSPSSTPVATPKIEHSYSNPGEYLVYVVASSSNGEISFRSNSLLVTVVEISLIADKSVIEVGDRVQFTGSVNPALDNVTYIFTVGDSTINRFQPDFEHVFSETGKYEVTFTAFQNNRIVSSDPYVITVHSDLNLTLYLDSYEAGTGVAIQFTALGLPADSGVEYNFHFGDGVESGWQANADASHAFDEEGSYEAFVEARLSPNQILQSSIQRINIGVGGFPNWILIVAGLVVLGIAGYLIVSGRILPGSGDGSTIPGTATTVVKPHIDQGKQEIASGTQFELGTEIRLKPFKDIGEQSIGNADNLIIKER